MKKICLIISFIICLLCFVGCKDQTEDVNNPNLPNQNQEQNQGNENQGDTIVEDPSDLPEDPGTSDVDLPTSGDEVENSGDVENVDKPNEDENIENPNEGEDVENPNEDENIENPDEGNNEETPNVTTSAISNTMTNMVAKAGAEVNAPMQEAIPAEVSSGFIGLETDEFNTYVEESVVYESMMGVFPQSICIVKINDASKVAELKQKIFNNSDTRKWICVSAEKAVVVDSGNYIMLAMGTKDICDKLVTAFSEEMGGNLGEVLSKMAE